jgi:hypothetical protein
MPEASDAAFDAPTAALLLVPVTASEPDLLLLPPARGFFDGERGDGVVMLLVRFRVLEPDGDALVAAPPAPADPLASALLLPVVCERGDWAGFALVGRVGLDVVVVAVAGPAVATGRIGRRPILHMGHVDVLFFDTHTL